MSNPRFPVTLEEMALLEKMRKDVKLRHRVELLCAGQIGRSIVTAEDAYMAVYTYLGGQPYESFVALSLDAQNIVLDAEVLAQGTVRGVDIDPSQVFRWFFTRPRPGASLMVAHNHPSRVCLPSYMDVSFTRNLQDLCIPLRVNWFGHLLITDTEYAWIPSWIV